MHRSIRVAGYAALSLTPAALLARTLAASGVGAGVVGLESTSVLVGGVLVGGVVAATGYEPAPFESSPEFGRADAARVAAAATAAVLTYVLSVRVGAGPVLASALVGLIAGVGGDLVDDGVGASAYCGSFAGMASTTLFPSVEYLAAAGLIAGLAFVAARRTFVGFGGKLGTLALFGCATTAILTGADYAAGSPLPWDTARLVVPVTVVAAVLTVVLSVRLDLGAVVGSALVGLAAGLAFPALAPGTGETLATAAFCASFVGMSTPERLRSEAHVALAGGLCGVVFVAVAAAFAGAGGKLGTVAFVSCLAVSGVERVVAARGRFA